LPQANARHEDSLQLQNRRLCTNGKNATSMFHYSCESSSQKMGMGIKQNFSLYSSSLLDDDRWLEHRAGPAMNRILQEGLCLVGICVGMAVYMTIGSLLDLSPVCDCLCQHSKDFFGVLHSNASICDTHSILQTSFAFFWHFL